MDGYKVAFEREYKGFKIVAWWPENNGDALIFITRDGAELRKFEYPAYKVFNLAAHFEDIVEGELRNSTDGYAIAGSDGLGGCVSPKPVS